MKIWVIARSYPTKQNKMRGSFELEQAQLLAENGHKITYLSAILHPLHKVKKWGYCHFNDGKVSVHTQSVFFAPERMHLHINFLLKKVWENLFLKVEKEEGLPDIIHIHYPGMVCYPEVVKEYQKKGVRIVITDHWSHTMNNTMDKFQRKQLIKFADVADKIACVSNPLKKSFIEITKTKKDVKIIPNVVSSQFTALSGENDVESSRKDEYNFIFVGRLAPVKQVDKIILAFSEVFAGKENIKLTIVGGGAEKTALENLVESNNVKNQITLTGTLTREKTALNLSKSNALVCFSTYETFGVPIIEAWACGKPVIVPDCVGCVESWSDDLGYLIPKNDISALKKAMKDIYDNRNKYNSQKISEFSSNSFGEKAVYKKLIEIYSEI